MTDFTHDIRLDQVKKIVESLVTSTMYSKVNVFIKGILPADMYVLVDDTLLYVIPLKDVVEYYEPLGFVYQDLAVIETEDWRMPNNPRIQNYVNNIYMESNNIITNSKIVAHDDDLRLNEEFENLLSLKADDGMKFFKLPGLELNTTYLIPMFSGFPNISKQDKIGITVYDTGSNFLLVNMNIFKKKINREINMIYKILKL